MRVDVKICGLTRPADAALAIAHGAWRLGVVFAGGPRNVSQALAGQIVAAAGPVPVIGVYRLQDVATILQISGAVGLRGAQLHGDYSREAARQLQQGGLEVWRVASIAPDRPASQQVEDRVENADVLLAEPRHADGRGGKGVAMDLQSALEARRAVHGPRFALAGGLTPATVVEAIRVVGPDLVDVSSGIESGPGIKDPAKLVRFLEQVRDAHPRA